MSCIPRVVTADINRHLLSPFTAFKVQQAIFQMHPSKAPARMVCQASSSKNTGSLLVKIWFRLFYLW